MIDGRGAARADDAQGTPTQRNTSPSILRCSRDTYREIYHQVYTKRIPGRSRREGSESSCGTRGGSPPSLTLSTPPRLSLPPSISLALSLAIYISLSRPRPLPLHISLPLSSSFSEYRAVLEEEDRGVLTPYNLLPTPYGPPHTDHLSIAISIGIAHMSLHCCLG